MKIKSYIYKIKTFFMGEQHIPLQINDDGLVTNVGHDMGGSYEYTTNKDGESYDNCVVCGKQTQYKTSTHIDMRVGYVEGVGQTCYNCNTAGSSSGREMITIPKYWVLGTPNDQELGEKVRAYYWENYG
jgi:hypothetical protein